MGFGDRAGNRGFFRMSLRRSLLVIAVVMGLLAAPTFAASAATGFVGPVFDLSPSDGRVIAADPGQGVLTLRGDQVMDVIPLPGVTAVDQVRRGAIWAVTGAGADPTQDTGQALWFIENGEPRYIANLYAFEVANNPDGNDPFDSNPFAIHAIDDETALIVDAGANALLKARIDGTIEVMAVFPDELVSTANIKSLAGCPGSGAPFCNLPAMMPGQAVPTSLAVAADGTIYVGELKGFPGPTGASNIWRVAPTASNAACGSHASCTKAFSGGFTSIVDLAFTADGRLLVAEMDEASWAAVEIFGTVTGGTVSRCTIAGGACEEVQTGIPMLSSMVQVGRSLWVAQNILAPTGSEVVRIR